MPIVDAGELLGGAPRRFETSDCVVVLDFDGAPDSSRREGVGLLVERVRDVVSLRQSDIEGIGAGLFSRVAHVEGELVRMVNLSALRPFALDGAASKHQAQSANEAAMGRARAFCPDALPWERELFQNRALALRAGTDESVRGEGALTWVAVRMGGELFGLEMSWVREFAARPVATTVPGGPHDLVGLVNRRGEVVPLLDLRGALGLSTDLKEGGEIAFIECQGAALGLLLDAVEGVLAPDEARLLAPPATSRAGGFVRGAFSFRRETLALLDLPNLLQEGDWIERSSLPAS